MSKECNAPQVPAPIDKGQTASPASHTPGPWVWYSEDASMAILCRKSDGALGVDLEAHVLSVTICKNCSHGENHWAWGRCYTAKAPDARLIAAAPDLLEVLKDIAKQELSADMSVDDQLGGDFEGAYNHIIELARAAVTKAEGSSEGAAPQ